MPCRERETSATWLGDAFSAALSLSSVTRSKLRVDSRPLAGHEQSARLRAAHGRYEPWTREEAARFARCRSTSPQPQLARTAAATESRRLATVRSEAVQQEAVRAAANLSPLPSPDRTATGDYPSRSRRRSSRARQREHSEGEYERRRESAWQETLYSGRMGGPDWTSVRLAERQRLANATGPGRRRMGE